MTDVELTEDALGKFLDGLFARHSRTAVKAAIMVCMTAISIVMFTGSFWKAAWISFSVLVLSVFTTWRRYLEPLCFFVFVLAVIFACIEPDTLIKLQLAVQR
ncbi:hypothetical protein Q3C01_05140 [Bradyrhizobium sp. UFLA05-109]